MQKQKNKLSNLRAHCTALLISKNFNSHVTTEVNLADKSMHAYKIKQHSLRNDLKKYMNRLRLINVKKEDSIHIRERNILRMVDLTENDIFHAETKE